MFSILTSLQKILEPTYGILVYQEQVMQAASEMAGFTLGEADILRRAIGKKNSDAIAAQKRKFVTGALSKGINKKMPRRYMTISKVCQLWI